MDFNIRESAFEFAIQKVQGRGIEVGAQPAMDAVVTEALYAVPYLEERRQSLWGLSPQ